MKKIERKKNFILIIGLTILLSFILTSCGGDKTVKFGRYVNREESEDGLIPFTYIAIGDNNRAFIATDLAKSYLPNGEYVIKGDKLTVHTQEGEFEFKIKNETELVLNRFPDNEPLKKESSYIYEEDEEDKEETTKTGMNTEQDKETDNKENLGDLPPMVMIDNKLYMDTGKVAKQKKCGTWDGEITSEVPQDEKPTKNDQSNFGVGFGYQYGGEEGLDVYINGKWYVFREVFDK